MPARAVAGRRGLRARPRLRRRQPRRLDEYRGQLGALELRLVTLAPGPAVALARDRARQSKHVAEHWVHLDQIMRAELAGVGLWIDTAQLTPDEVVARILAQPQRASVAGG